MFSSHRRGPIREFSRIRTSSHRHAAPSGPWPWMDFDSDSESDLTRSPVLGYGQTDVDSECRGYWSEYPQSLFPNWTPSQVRKSGIAELCEQSGICTIHYLDAGHDGQFSDTLSHSVSERSKEEFWTLAQIKRPEGIRVRVLFVEDLSFIVLQILGTKYNIEPFYFSSSLNWIPSLYQEDVRLAHGDHITITLTYLRTTKVPTAASPGSPSSSHNSSATSLSSNIVAPQFHLRSDNPTKDGQILLLDVLAIHMVRSYDSSTIISYHSRPTIDRETTSAKHLHSRIYLAGQSVYWQDIFKKSQDPTFVLLTMLWYALYAWDEALESLWVHISLLESSAMRAGDMSFTQELHAIQASLLHYGSLLEDFRKSVIFVLETPNPALDSASLTDHERQISKDLMKRECETLLVEINRLMVSRASQNNKLKNVMNLTISTINIEDSRRMQRLTEVAVRDSAAMRKIAYLTMFFLPASFTASVFGMNIREINPGTLGSIAHYAAAAIPFTAVTIWILMALQGQGRWRVGEDGRTVSIWTRLWWPFIVVGHFVWKGLMLGSRIILRRRIVERRNGRSVGV